MREASNHKINTTKSPLNVANVPRFVPRLGSMLVNADKLEKQVKIKRDKAHGMSKHAHVCFHPFMM